MYKTFDDSLHALLNDEGLHEARGGQVIKHAEGFTYRLHGQAEEEEGAIFFELNPSIEPGETWKVMPLTHEAREAYRAFTLNPANGELVPSR